jgi:uncharacterized YigZ family protein
LFLTVQKTGNAVIKEKGSKFLGKASPCNNEVEAKRIIESLRKDNPGCVHVCYAYRFGADHKNFRYSDDGEPSNSAGSPIFGQIKSFDLTNVLLTVVRYYGGINLGVGGLIQAYKLASKLAIENTEIIEQEEMKTFHISFSYNILHLVMNVVKATDCTIIEKNLQSAVEMQLSMPISNQTLIPKLEKIKGLNIN